MNKVPPTIVATLKSKMAVRMVTFLTRVNAYGHYIKNPKIFVGNELPGNINTYLHNHLHFHACYTF